MDLWSKIEGIYIEGRRVPILVKLTNGKVVNGEFYGYTTAIDNDPDPASIDVLLDENSFTEIYEPEIDSIEILGPAKRAV